jgi:hypothetical protein
MRHASMRDAVASGVPVLTRDDLDPSAKFAIAGRFLHASEAA